MLRTETRERLALRAPESQILAIFERLNCVPGGSPFSGVARFPKYRSIILITTSYLQI